MDVSGAPQGRSASTHRWGPGACLILRASGRGRGRSPWKLSGFSIFECISRALRYLIILKQMNYFWTIILLLAKTISFGVDLYLMGIRICSFIPLWSHTNLSLRKTCLNTLAGVARGQRSASFAYKKILYLIGPKYTISFLFWSEIKTHTRLLREKTW